MELDLSVEGQGTKLATSEETKYYYYTPSKTNSVEKRVRFSLAHLFMIIHVLLGVTSQRCGRHQMFARPTRASIDDVADPHYHHQQQYIIASSYGKRGMLFLRFFQKVLDFERFIKV